MPSPNGVALGMCHTPLYLLEERLRQARINEAAAARTLLDGAGLSTDQARKHPGCFIDPVYQVNQYQYEVCRKLTDAAQDDLETEAERLRRLCASPLPAAPASRPGTAAAQTPPSASPAPPPPAE